MRCIVTIGAVVCLGAAEGEREKCEIAANDLKAGRSCWKRLCMC